MNRSFFRFAFAFMSMIAISVVVILALGTTDSENAVAKPCQGEGCVEVEK